MIKELTSDVASIRLLGRGDVDEYLDVLFRNREFLQPNEPVRLAAEYWMLDEQRQQLVAGVTRGRGLKKYPESLAVRAARRGIRVGETISMLHHQGCISHMKECRQNRYSPVTIAGRSNLFQLVGRTET
jgi:hypothetical protein